MVLPSKKVITLFGACGIAVGSIAFAAIYSSKINLESQPTNLIADTSNVIKNQILENDTDNDTLKDWEEVLWKTNPKLADTDGDGTSDGAEVKAQRDPMIAGPDDKLATAISNTTTTASSTAASGEIDSSITARFGRDFFEQYMKLKQTSGEVNETDQTALIQQVLATYEGSVSGGQRFTINNIAVIDDTSTSIKNYGNTIGSIFAKNSINQMEGDIIINELYLAGQASNTQSPEYLEKIPKIIASYENIIRELKTTSVPYSMSTLHVDLMNGFLNAVYSDQLIMQMFTDPVSSVFGIQTYIKTMEQIQVSLKSMQGVYTKFNVTYRQDEPGFQMALGLY
ncbi:MAG: hypothetical protein V4519_00380 [Patescibacteria group bacterium]